MSRVGKMNLNVHGWQRVPNGPMLEKGYIKVKGWQKEPKGSRLENYTYRSMVRKRFVRGP